MTGGSVPERGLAGGVDLIRGFWSGESGWASLRLADPGLISTSSPDRLFRLPSHSVTSQGHPLSRGASVGPRHCLRASRTPWRQPRPCVTPAVRGRSAGRGWRSGHLRGRRTPAQRCPESVRRVGRRRAPSPCELADAPHPARSPTADTCGAETPCVRSGVRRPRWEPSWPRPARGPGAVLTAKVYAWAGRRLCCAEPSKDRDINRFYFLY